MNDKKDILEDVAFKIFSNLHSSANENFLSSLLAASLNESKEFMKKFLKRARVPARCFPNSDFYAQANICIPKGLRGKGDAQYYRPDIFLLDGRFQEKWDNLRKKKNCKSWDGIHAVIVEIKHTDLLSEDKKKYISFIRHTDGKCGNEGVRFVILSSHTKRGLRKGERQRVGAIY